MSKLDELINLIEEEAEAGGPEARAELAATRTRFRLARELRNARVERGLTQTELAKMTGIDQGDISRIEAANGNPTLDTITTLTSALDVDLHALTREQSASLALA